MADIIPSGIPYKRRISNIFSQSTELNALEEFKNLVVDLSSLMVKREVLMGEVSDTGTLGRVQLSGTLALFPRRFLK